MLGIYKGTKLSNSKIRELFEQDCPLNPAEMRIITTWVRRVMNIISKNFGFPKTIEKSLTTVAKAVSYVDHDLGLYFDNFEITCKINSISEGASQSGIIANYFHGLEAKSMVVLASRHKDGDSWVL